MLGRGLNVVPAGRSTGSTASLDVLLDTTGVTAVATVEPDESGRSRLVIRSGRLRNPRATVALEGALVSASGPARLADRPGDLAPAKRQLRAGLQLLVLPRCTPADFTTDDLANLLGADLLVTTTVSAGIARWLPHLRGVGLPGRRVHPGEAFLVSCRDDTTIASPSLLGPPIARIAAVASSVVGEVIRLDGAASSFPTRTGTSTFRWSIGSGSAVLGSPSAPVTTCVASLPGSLVVSLAVSDGCSLASTSATIAVGMRPNRPPQLANRSVAVAMPLEFTLDAREATDPDGDQLTFFWRQVGGPQVELSNPDSPNPRFTPQLEGQYDFVVTADDGNGTPVHATVTVRARRGDVEIYNNGVWIAKAVDDPGIPEPPMEIVLDGRMVGRRQRIDFIHRVGTSFSWPVFFVIYSSGYLRLKPLLFGSDGSFGSSIVLGPAVFLRDGRLFNNPVLTRISIGTSTLSPATGKGDVTVTLDAAFGAFGGGNATPLNALMTTKYDLLLREPGDPPAPVVELTASFEVRAPFELDALRAALGDAWRWIRYSGMWISPECRDCSALEFTGAGGVPNRIAFSTASFGRSLFATATDLGGTKLDLLQARDGSCPVLNNFRTPSLRIELKTPAPPMRVQGFVTGTSNPNDDNVSAHVQPRELPLVWPSGTTGSLGLTLTTTLGEFESRR